MKSGRKPRVTKMLRASKRFYVRRQGWVLQVTRIDFFLTTLEIGCKQGSSGIWFKLTKTYSIQSIENKVIRGQRLRSGPSAIIQERDCIMHYIPFNPCQTQNISGGNDYDLPEFYAFLISRHRKEHREREFACKLNVVPVPYF